jgi:hypothetical protein
MSWAWLPTPSGAESWSFRITTRGAWKQENRYHPLAEFCNLPCSVGIFGSVWSRLFFCWYWLSCTLAQTFSVQPKCPTKKITGRLRLSLHHYAIQQRERPAGRSAQKGAADDSREEQQQERSQLVDWCKRER